MALAQATTEAAQLPPHLLNLAVERSGGSPEFLLDLLAAAAGGHPDELPDSVGAATMARIDALDPRDGVVVRRAAVLGLMFDPRRLADVLDDDTAQVDDGFWERLSTVFVREADGQVRFRRPAVQEAAYASLPFKLRRQLHLAVGLRLEREQGIEPDADPAVLSQHFALAGDHVRAHRYAMIAGRRATERFSHADAAQLYRRAIDAGRAYGLAADSRTLADAWEQLGEALRCMGEPEAAAQALTEARRLLRNDPIAQARICHSHGKVAERSTSLTAAVRWLQRGLRWADGVAGADAVACRAQIRSYLGGIRNRQGRWAEAISTCRQAIAEAEAVGELSALAHACYALDWALVESGRPEQATHSWRALELFEQLGDPEHESAVLNNLGMFAYFDGRWDEAVALYERAAACSDRAGRPADAALTDCNVGEILSDQGRLDEAETHLQRARRVWSATGERQAVAFVDVLLTRLAARRGSCPDGARALEEAADELRRSGVEAYAAFAQALVAEVHAFAGDAARALHIARQELSATERHRPLLERVSGIALARLGRSDEAETQLRSALASARQDGARVRSRGHDRGARFARCSRGGHAPRPRRDRRALEDRAAAGAGAQLSPAPGILAGDCRDQHLQHRVLAAGSWARLGEQAGSLRRRDGGARRNEPHETGEPVRQGCGRCGLAGKRGEAERRAEAELECVGIRVADHVGHPVGDVAPEGAADPELDRIGIGGAGVALAVQVGLLTVAMQHAGRGGGAGDRKLGSCPRWLRLARR